MEGSTVEEVSCHLREKYGSCEGLPFYREHEGERYCVLHYPGYTEKITDFHAEINRKLDEKDYDFRGAWFPSPHSFQEYQFEGTADFSCATFNIEPGEEWNNTTYFLDSKFCSDVYFRKTTFCTKADFGRVCFEGDADFSGAIFEGRAEFTAEVHFDKQADFSAATFGAAADFSEARFSGGVRLSETEFHGGAYFPETVLCAIEEDLTLDFSQAVFHQEAVFDYARFYADKTSFSLIFSGDDDHEGSLAPFLGKASFAGATFGTEYYGRYFDGNAYFSGVEFPQEAEFSGATFYGEAHFWSVTFHQNAEFYGTRFFGPAYFNEKAKFLAGANFIEAKFTEGGRAGFVEAEFADSVAFDNAVLDDASFGSASFKEVWFAPTSFGSADFSNTTFDGRVDFRGSTWNRANFREAEFCGDTDFTNNTFEKSARFSDATFEGKANFTNTTFNAKRTDFRRVNFKRELYFKAARFNEYTDFYRASFLDTVHFIRDEEAENEEPSEVFAPDGHVSFTRARIEKPELFSFDTLRLRPSWLVGVDARKFNFTDVGWYGLPDGPEGSIGYEIKIIRERHETGSPYTLLAQACQRLAANAEENHQYPLANEFHYWSMDTLRRGSWSPIYRAWLKEDVQQSIMEGKRQDITRLRDLRFGELNAKALLEANTWQSMRTRRHFGVIRTLYWALSGYGVRPLRAFVVLLIISIVFALLYSWPYVEAPYSLQAFEGLTYGYWGGPLDYLGYFLRTEMYSLGVLARLNPEPKPTPGLFQTLVIVEGIMGPVQIALFLLAVRRKVMR